MDGGGTWQYRLLLIGRAQWMGILWGVVFGEVTWGALGVGAVLSGRGDADGVLAMVVFAPLAGIVGGVVGGTIGFTAGLALALSERRVLQHLVRSRLVAGSVAAAVPLAVALNLHRPRPWDDYVIPAGIAVAAAVTAVLLTPPILYGPPPPAEWRRAIPPRTAPAPIPEQGPRS